MHKVHVIFASIFVVITIPLVILLYQSYSQLQLGTNSLYTGHAMFVANTLNQRLARDLAVEEKRSYSEYGFIRTVQVIGGEENTLSELVDYPITSQYTAPHSCPKGVSGKFSWSRYLKKKGCAAKKSATKSRASWAS